MLTKDGKKTFCKTVISTQWQPFNMYDACETVKQGRNIEHNKSHMLKVTGNELK